MQLSRYASNKRELDQLLKAPFPYMLEHGYLSSRVRHAVSRRQALDKPRARKRFGLAEKTELRIDKKEVLEYAGLAIMQVFKDDELLWNESSLNINVVAKVGRRKLFDGVITGSVARITKMRFGGNGTTPTEDDEDVTSAYAGDITLFSLVRTNETMRGSVFLDITMMNDVELVEAALLFSDGVIYNHFLIDPVIEKDLSKTVLGTVDSTAMAA